MSALSRIAARIVGLSVVVVNSSMSASFVGTIEDQVDRAFARDFTVQAQGSGTLTYQWQRNGVNIAGATTSST